MNATSQNSTSLTQLESAAAQLVLRYAQDDVTGATVIPERRGTTTEWPNWLEPSLRSALAQLGAPQAWLHQAQTAEYLHSHHHTVLATGTGSGKSLAVWVPVLNSVLAHRRAAAQVKSLGQVRRRPTALYLSPTKALAADQESTLTKLVAALPSQNNLAQQVHISTVDGDTSSEVRSWARSYADIVLTNPDFLHHAIMPRHELWSRFLSGLEVIVVDEFHNYRGNFGSHVALILRRILRLARYHGAAPSVAFLSATSNNPELAAQLFIGEAAGPVKAVSDDASPSGKKELLTLRCREIPTEQPDDPEHEPSDTDNRKHSAGNREPSSDFVADDADGLPTEVKRRAATTEAGELTAQLVAHNVRTLTFVRSRAAAERVAEVARARLHEIAPQNAGKVFAYRGGYLPEERRALEEALRSGEILALATTSALELGIDISGLDAVVVTGWPGTHASFWQQIGRSGRAGKNGIAVFIGRDNPLDQYLLDHPENLSLDAVESNVFDPHNLGILVPHLCAAAAEIPLTELDCAVFDLSNSTLFAELSTQGLLKKRSTGWYWNTGNRIGPHSLADLRGSGNTVSIIDGDSGALLGTVDQAQADTTVHPGAIYLHQGIPYQVDARELDSAIVHRHREEEIRTFAREESNVVLLETQEQVQFEHGVLCSGIVEVNSRVVGYDIRRVRDGLHLGMVPLALDFHSLRTNAVWFTVSESALIASGLGVPELAGALHAAEHTMIGLLPLFATCDRWDLGGLSTSLHPDTGAPTIIVHDSGAGGTGHTRVGYTQILPWLEATYELLNDCDCSSGCPRCVQSPKCGNNNYPLSKSGAKLLVKLVLDELTRALSS